MVRCSTLGHYIINFTKMHVLVIVYSSEKVCKRKQDKFSVMSVYLPFVPLLSLNKSASGMQSIHPVLFRCWLQLYEHL